MRYMKFLHKFFPFSNKSKHLKSQMNSISIKFAEILLVRLKIVLVHFLIYCHSSLAFRFGKKLSSFLAAPHWVPSVLTFLSHPGNDLKAAFEALNKCMCLSSVFQSRVHEPQENSDILGDLWIFPCNSIALVHDQLICVCMCFYTHVYIHILYEYVQS